MLDFSKQTFEQVIPENLLKDSKVRHLARSLQKHIDEVTSWSKRLNYTQNLHDLPDDILDHLLWEKHITWNEGLALAKTREQKINLIEAAIELHRTKGTPEAVENVLAALNLYGQVFEWYQYDADPYYFKVEIELQEIRENTLQLLNSLINEYKNERSWLDNISLLFPRHSVHLREVQYHYPVYYPIAAYHWTEGMPGAYLASSFTLNSTPYHYPVYYPIANDYGVDGMPGEVTRQNTSLVHATAGLINPYPVCGTFFGGGY